MFIPRFYRSHYASFKIGVVGLPQLSIAFFEVSGQKSSGERLT